MKTFLQWLITRIYYIIFSLEFFWCHKMTVAIEMFNIKCNRNNRPYTEMKSYQQRISYLGNVLNKSS